MTLNAIAQDLRMVVLLAGRVGPNTFADGIGRSVLDLPVAAGRSVFDVWVERLAELTGAARRGGVRVRIAVDRESDVPRRVGSEPVGSLQFEVVRDGSDYRGTAGVVRDLTQDLEDADLVLVATANQVQHEPLARVVPELLAAGEGVSLVPHGPGEFAGVFLLRRDRMLAVPSVGFMDLKEQALPETARERPLRVVRRPPGASLPLRTLEEYVAALRHLGGRPAADPASATGAFTESWEAQFAIVEDGADVAPSAVIQDTVVLAGARVEAGAVVARSVVCPGAVVRRGTTVVDEVVVA